MQVSVYGKYMHTLPCHYNTLMYEDRVVGSSRIQSYKTVHMHVEKEGPLSIGYKIFNQTPVF